MWDLRRAVLGREIRANGVRGSPRPIHNTKLASESLKALRCFSTLLLVLQDLHLSSRQELKVQYVASKSRLLDKTSLLNFDDNHPSSAHGLEFNITCKHKFSKI